MMRELLQSVTVYLVTGYSDLRQGIDGLATRVQGTLSLDPYSRSLFLFCGRRRDRIKGLLWEGDGFLLLYKRLDNGVFRWPRTETEARMADRTGGPLVAGGTGAGATGSDQARKTRGIVLISVLFYAVFP